MSDDNGTGGDETSPAEKFAEEAHNLDAARKAVEDAASVSAGIWLSYIFVLFYIGIAAAAVTHADLLLESRVKLPFLGVDLPLVAFFFLAPILFIVSHAYTLVHFVMLAAKVGAFDQELRAQLGGAPETREGLRRQLPSNIFVQLLAGPEDISKGGLGFLLTAITWITLVIGPILLLLLIQAKFLPYHLEWVTWVQRFAVLVDVILLWLLWPAVLEKRSKITWPQFWRSKLVALVSLIPIWLAFITATFPGEPMYNWVGPNSRFANLEQIGLPSVHNLLFEGPIEGVYRGRQSPFSATLVLVDKLEEDTKGFTDVEHTIVLRGRHLEGAVFNASFLRNVDLTGAQLQNASLEGAHLQVASLNKAQLQRAWLKNADLQGADLGEAQLQGASLDHAKLQGAVLDDANLQGASLDGLELQGASRDDAKLQGASLDQAKLQGASLPGAHLQGAKLDGVHLEGAKLDGAQLQGATLKGAVFKATSLNAANVWRAQLDLDQVSTIQQIPELIWENLEPWIEKDYDALKARITENVLPGARRDAALQQIENLDPSKPEDKANVEARNKAHAAPGGKKHPQEDYPTMLAAELRQLACSGDAETPYIVRGLVKNGRIKDTYGKDTGHHPHSDVVNAILSPDCMVSSALTEQDKANLKQLAKQAQATESKQ